MMDQKDANSLMEWSKPKTDLECPFCHENDFDLIGLKGHLVYDCKDFESIQTVRRVF